MIFKNVRQLNRRIRSVLLQYYNQNGIKPGVSIILNKLYLYLSEKIKYTFTYILEESIRFLAKKQRLILKEAGLIDVIV